MPQSAIPNAQWQLRIHARFPLAFSRVLTDSANRMPYGFPFMFNLDLALTLQHRS